MAGDKRWLTDGVLAFYTILYHRLTGMAFTLRTEGEGGLTRAGRYAFAWGIRLARTGA